MPRNFVLSNDTAELVKEWASRRHAMGELEERGGDPNWEESDDTAVSILHEIHRMLTEEDKNVGS